jgi:hypothetical protein
LNCARCDCANAKFAIILSPMGRASERYGVALAIFGILVSLILAVLSAVKASSVAITVCAVVTILLIVLLYVPAMTTFYRDTCEELQRKRLRKKRGLKLVTDDDTDQPPLRLPDGIYGYEEIFSIAGLRSTGQHANEARIKPDRMRPDGYPYPLEDPLEVHRFKGQASPSSSDTSSIEERTWLVGYVSASLASWADDVSKAGQLSLWMRRTKQNKHLTSIALSRVTNETTRGDRNWDSSAKNLYRLVLDLQPGRE